MSEVNHIAFVDENSAHDRLLSLLTVVVLVCVLALGIYWQSLPLPEAQAETEHTEK